MSFSWVLFSAFIVGLVGSGHCLGMCGGIAAAFSPTLSHQKPLQSFSFTIIFNLGRIFSYAIAGASVGALSYFVGGQIDIHYWSQTLRFATGLTIAAIGLALLFRLSVLNILEQLGQPIWRRLAPYTSALRPAGTHWKVLLLGMLWGWIPCGMVYSMLLVALMSGQPHYGSLTMISFGLGTLPSMVLSGAVLARLGQMCNRKQLARYAGMLCLVFGMWTALAPHMPLPEHQQHPLSANTDLCETD